MKDKQMTEERLMELRQHDVALRKATRRTPSPFVASRMRQNVMLRVQQEQAKRERREEILTWLAIAAVTIGGLAVLGVFCGKQLVESMQEILNRQEHVPLSLWIHTALLGAAFLGLNRFLRRRILNR